MSEHISRKELKQDKFRESIEHGAEALFSHKTFATVVVVLIAAIVVGMGGWRIYTERRDVQASAALDDAMKAYTARIRMPGQPAEAGELSYLNEAEKMQDAALKFGAVADKFPKSNPGRLARYYCALSYEALDRTNQALENLKKLDGTSDKELDALARYQTAQIYARTGKAGEAVKIYRELADKNSVFVPRGLVLLELAVQLRASNPKEAADVYAQIKREYPNTQLAEQADRGLDLLPKS